MTVNSSVLDTGPQYNEIFHEIAAIFQRELGQLSLSIPL